MSPRNINRLRNTRFSTAVWTLISREVGMVGDCVTCFLRYSKFFQRVNGWLKLTNCLFVCIPYLYYYSLSLLCVLFCLFACFCFVLATGHRIVAGGSAGSGSSDVSFPSARLGSENSLACCGIYHDIDLRLD